MGIVGEDGAERCTECGYRYAALSREEIPPRLRALGTVYAGVLEGHDAAALRAHVRPGSWSVLEYGCHFRDVLIFQHQRIALAQVEDRPRFACMRRDERAVETAYNRQPPGSVAGALRRRSAALADQLAGLDAAGWARTGIYQWPRTQVRTVEWIGRHTVHEGEHHLWDIERLLAAR
jgi:hypothetical protein